MMLPTDAAMTTRRSSLSGTLAALIGLPCLSRVDISLRAWMVAPRRAHPSPGWRCPCGGRAHDPRAERDRGRTSPALMVSPRNAGRRNICHGQGSDALRGDLSPAGSPFIGAPLYRRPRGPATADLGRSRRTAGGEGVVGPADARDHVDDRGAGLALDVRRIGRQV